MVGGIVVFRRGRECRGVAEGMDRVNHSREDGMGGGDDCSVLGSCQRCSVEARRQDNR